ncbi:MAG: ParB/RepB/Spo0J family partition protein [Alphaproteobacteria bacterium]|nr:ParB/RepB/Spo0J family partition protein [Alphaproteobacteria bacterium]MBM4435897.1 ParB/RepB/Spo0J family partition protein [Actinomycetota bacterium]
MTEEATKRHGLGRGLSALLGEDSTDYAALDKVRATKEVPIERLRPGKYQPRRRFDAEEIAELVASVRARGILQPILVRRVGEGADEAYEIIAGERRWRAAQQAQLHQVPVVIKDLSDADALEVALVENLQRQNLTPLEEAEGYRRLMDEFGHTQERLAKSLGKSRSHLANTLRLLGLPEEVKSLLDDGSLTAGHARALLGASDPVGLAQRAVRQNLNVRQVEKLAQGGDAPAKQGRPAPEKSADTRALEHDITGTLGLPVAIRHRGDKGGEVRVGYRTLEQLDEICKRLARVLSTPADTVPPKESDFTEGQRSAEAGDDPLPPFPTDRM